MVRPIITAARLRELLHYDPSTGAFAWRVSRGNVAKGDVAGGPSANGYTKIRVEARLYLAHRLAWLYVHGEWPPHQIDHVNGARSDNRIGNLRSATSAENHQNIRAAMTNNKSGLLGVFAKRGKFASCIGLDGKNKFLGTFETPELANAAYLQAKASIHPYQTICEGTE